ncbi:MAG: hypothetical protein R3F39_21990 [Myxococcota bacterium]
MHRIVMTALTAVALLASAPAWSIAPPPIDECLCVEADLVSSYGGADEVFAARIGASVTLGATRYYRATVLRTYKGCTARGQRVILSTPSSAQNCGAKFLTGGGYLVHSDAGKTPSGVPVYEVGGCSYNVLLKTLNAEERDWLRHRYNCCGEKCGCVDGSKPVDCVADPCAIDTCTDGTCVSNFCGGCFAEHTDPSGQQVCQACEADADCGIDQYCSDDGECRISGVEPTNCLDGGACEKDEWCRTTQDEAVGECVPFATEGESCGGFTPPWAQMVCAPELTCTDVPPFIADIPGKCRVPCEEDAGCGAEQYCAPQGFCRDHGACFELADCSADNNDWAHIECVGYATCESGACGWECGDPQCQELGSVFFGPCDAVLGAAIIGGTCQTVSGCDAQGYTLFESLEACQTACAPAPSNRSGRSR